MSVDDPRRAIAVREHRTQRSAVTLSQDGRLTVEADPFLDPADGEVAVLFDRLRDVARIAEATLDGLERRAVIEVVFGGLTVGLEYADAPGVEQRPLALERLRAALDSGVSRLAAAERRRALQRYVEGMLIGILVVLVLAGAARLGLIYIIRNTVPGTMLFPTVLVAGAFGGLVSALARITRGDIRIPTGGHDAEIRFLGMLRPFVGVVFGTGVAILLLSDVLPVKLPESSDLRPFYVVGLAFIAGFLERFAQEFPGRVRSQGS